MSMKFIQIPFVYSAFLVALGTLVLVTNSAIATDAVTYSMKGEIRALPGVGRASNEVLIKHEAVPEYRDTAGKVVGMSAMTMPFYLKDGVALGDLKVGDRVAFKVEARFEPRFTEEVVSIEKAP